MNTTVILTTQRTGSTFLCYWLNNHPHAYIYNEVFHRNSPACDAFRYHCMNNLTNGTFYPFLTNRAFYRFRINLLPKRWICEYLHSLVHNPEHSAPFPKFGEGRQHHAKIKQARLIGFKLMYDQLSFFSPLRQWILSNNTAVIHLLRRNLLKNFISNERLRQFGISHSYKNVQAGPIQFEYRKFLKFAHKIEDRREYHRKVFQNTNPYLELCYEDMFDELEVAKNTILSFLDLENVDIKIPDLKKISTSSLENEITNHEEARNVISSSKYADMLRDFGASK